MLLVLTLPVCCCALLIFYTCTLLLLLLLFLFLFFVVEILSEMQRNDISVNLWKTTKTCSFISLLRELTHIGGIQQSP